MGWTPISYACGHTGREQMYGKSSGRDQRADYLGQYDCPDCRALQGQERGCLPLRGTEKQKAWAGDLRAKYLTQHTDMDAATCATLPVASSTWIDARNNLSSIQPKIKAAVNTAAPATEEVAHA